MFLWKQSWGEDIFFAGSGSTLNYFRPLRLFFCWSREKLPWCESSDPSAAPQRVPAPLQLQRSTHPHVLQSFTWSHLGTPVCTIRHLMESSQDFVFGRLPEKAQRTPQVELQENKEETDGMKELPKNFPSPWPQLFPNHFSFQNELFPWAMA